MYLFVAVSHVECQSFDLEIASSCHGPAVDKCYQRFLRGQHEGFLVLQYLKINISVPALPQD